MPDFRPELTSPSPNRGLEDWKEIAAYLHCSVRTAQRWRRNNGLPIHTREHNGRPFAYPEELDAWTRRESLELVALPDGKADDASVSASGTSEPATEAAVCKAVGADAPAAADRDLQPGKLRPRKPAWPWALVASSCLAVVLLLPVVLATRNLRTGPSAPRPIEPIGRALALSTCEGCRMETIPVGRRPVTLTIAKDGREVYVSNLEDNTVSVINTATRQVTHTLPVPETPEVLAAAPVREEIYVGSRGWEFSIINTRTKQVRSIPTEGPVRDLAVTPNGERVYLAMDASGLRRFSTASGQMTTVPTVDCPHALALDPSGKQLWISYQGGGPGGRRGSDSIEVMDVATERSIGFISGLVRVGGSIAVSPSGAFVWASGANRCYADSGQSPAECAQFPSGILHILNAAHLDVIKTLYFRPEMQITPVFAPDGSRVFTTQCDRLSAFDPSSFSEIESADMSVGKLAFSRGVVYAPLPHRGAVAILPTTGTQCEPPGERLRHFWSADGVPNDLRSGTHLRPEGLQYAPGRIGQAFQFGSNSRGASADLYMALFHREYPDVTLAFWLKKMGGAREQTILSQSASFGPVWRVWVDVENRVRFRRGEAELASQPLYRDHDWYHVAVRRVAGQFELLIDGRPQARTPAIRMSTELGVSVLRIGSDDLGGDPFNGLLDEIVYYERGLSDAEVKKLWHADACRAQ